MNNIKILFDLTSAVVGKREEQRKISGQLFSALGSLTGVELHGLLSTNQENPFAIEGRVPATRAEAIERANFFFHAFLGHEKQHYMLVKTLRNFFRKFVLLRNKAYQLYEIDSLFHEVIWRNIFHHILPYKEQAILFNKKYFYTNLLNNSQGRLHTKNYDFVIFSEPNAVCVSPNTKKIICLSSSENFSDQWEFILESLSERASL